MQTSPGPWIEALRHSHDTLQAIAGPLDASALRGQSYDRDWSIAQVLSHLGSQAEIFSLFLDAALDGQDPPGPDAFPRIWADWDAKSPQDQAADALRVDDLVTRRFEDLDTAQRDQLRLNLFGMDLDTAGLARIRLGEHAVHTWDVAVALDPAAKVAPDAVELLVDALEFVVARAAKPAGPARRIHVATTSPLRHFTLETGESATLIPDGGHDGQPELALPAEALIRLVYGRLDSAHTPPLETRGVDLDDLRRIFPGF